MKRHIIVTLILLALTAYVTVVYFKTINSPETHTRSIISVIPDNTPFIFEFSNDNSFYDIVKGDSLFCAVIGQQTFAELDTLRRTVLQNPLLKKYFTGQNLYISLYPSADKKIDLLLTMSATNGFLPNIITQLGRQANTGLIIKPLNTAAKYSYTFYISALKKNLYVVNQYDNVYSCSFSEQLIRQTAAYKPQKNKPSFILLSDQQSANSLANLYVNYQQLEPLFTAFFKNRNADVFKNFRGLPAFAALSLNYNKDALMFNGSTLVNAVNAQSYLGLFIHQQPVGNHLKDIFPSTSAYSTNFSVSDPIKFGADLSQWFAKTGQKTEKDNLFNKVQAETGISLQKRFDELLGNEFAVVTTRYFEKLAIIGLKDGSKMNDLLANISKASDINAGQFSYDKLPFFLLGEPLGIFKHPYYLIIDNYLILANSTGELKSFSDTYLNRKFLSKSSQYQQFDALLAGQSNVSFLLVFKNCEPIFKRDMNDDFMEALQNNQPGWKNFYGAAWQLSAVDKTFYTNFCLKLNTDTATVKN